MLSSKTRKLIETLLDLDTPVKEIARRAQVSNNTVYRVRDDMPRERPKCRCGLSVSEPGGQCDSCVPGIEFFAAMRRDRA